MCKKYEYDVCECIFHFVIFLDKGEVFGWGNNEYRQLCMTEDIQQVCSPIHISSTKNLGKIIDIAAGGSFCAVLNGKWT